MNRLHIALAETHRHFRTRAALVTRAGVTIAGIVALAGVAHAQAQFTARLTTAQEVPAVVGTAQGTASLTLTSAGLQFFVTVEGLTGPVTAAHFHRGAAGVGGGPVVREITADFGGDNSASGLWTAADAEPLTPAIIADLLSGNIYLNVHTSANLAGEVRGQVVLSGGTHFTANLNGQQENPALPVTGTGTGNFILTDDDRLQFRITANGLTGAITGAHLHLGGIGQNGGIEVDLGPFFVGTTAVGSVPLTVAQRNALIGGRIYVNIHTVANGGGEIRGQLILAGGFGLSARMNGGQEDPPNAATGTATAALTWTSAGVLIDLTANGLTGAITDAHIHRGAPGSSGPVVRTLTPDFTGTTAQAIWRASDAEALTPALLADLLAGNLYLNIHTAAFPGGEIRGQIALNHPGGASPTSSFSNRMTGSQEEPPLGVAGRGTGFFRFTPAGLEYSVTVTGLTGAITASHFHNRAIGANGGVVRDIVFVNGTATGTWTPADAQPLTAALITELFKGNLYVNVHTAANGGGEIRGQVLPASGADFLAMITGKEESPTSVATGLGTGSFTLTPGGLWFSVTVTGLTGAITGAHFHQAAAGSAGGIVRDITADFVNNTAIGVWKPTDAQPLSPALANAILTEGIYVNIHTAANPGGEIRGQLRLVGGVSHRASLTGGAEVGPVQTLGAGTAAMTLTDQGLVFRVSANDLSGTLTDAHFHNAPFGANGPVVRTITPEFVALTAQGVWNPFGAEPITPALIGAIQREEIYINLHTTTNPGGEIRGQLGTPDVTGVDPPVDGGGALQLAIFPNPTVRETQFAFHLPSQSRVDLGVFDLQGRKVATVARGDYAAGPHRVRFDARGLQTGLYLFRLEAAGRRQSGKLLITH